MSTHSSQTLVRVGKRDYEATQLPRQGFDREQKRSNFAEENPTMYRAAIFLLLAAATVQGQELQSGPVAGSVAAQSLLSTSHPTSVEQENASRWFARIGVVAAIYHSSATFATGGVAIPDASAQASNNESVTFDIGYNITKNISTQLMLGIPPEPTITGQGTVAKLEELGAVRYGPGIFSGLYRVRRWGAFQPYVGPGVAYAIILKDHDASVTDLHVANNFGVVLQAGAEYRLGERWSIFGDFKEIWLAVNAHGLVGGAVPVTAHVPLNPSLISTGVKFRFGRKPR
jgi:outer membrane protein